MYKFLCDEIETVSITELTFLGKHKTCFPLETVIIGNYICRRNIIFAFVIMEFHSSALSYTSRHYRFVIDYALSPFWLILNLSIYLEKLQSTLKRRDDKSLCEEITKKLLTWATPTLLIFYFSLFKYVQFNKNKTAHAVVEKTAKIDLQNYVAQIDCCLKKTLQKQHGFLQPSLAITLCLFMHSRRYNYNFRVLQHSVCFNHA